MRSAMETHQLLVTLLALLPKDGTPVTVAALATAAGISQARVTNTLFDTWYAGQVGYDMPRSTAGKVLRWRDPTYIWRWMRRAKDPLVTTRSFRAKTS